MKRMLENPVARKEFYDFCNNYLGEDITETIDIAGKEDRLPLVRAALLLKQDLMDNYPVTYSLLKKEIKANE